MTAELTYPKLENSGKFPHALRAGLTQFQKRVLDFIESRKHLAQGVCLSTKTLATRFGVCTSYVQKTLRRLIGLGLVVRSFDYGLRSRRRFYPAGQCPATPLFGGREQALPAHVDPTIDPASSPPATPFVDGLQSVQSTDSSPFIPLPPLEPPYKVSGDIQEEETGSKASPPPGAIESIHPGPEQPGPEPTPAAASPIPPSVPAADPELVAKAAKVHPAHPAPARWLAPFLARWSRPWVAAALDRAEAKAKGAPLTNPPGYVHNTLRGFEAEGGPPAPAPTMEEIEARKRAERKAGMEVLKAHLASIGLGPRGATR